MTAWARTLEAAIALAASPGPVHHPAELIARCSAEAKPLAALAVHDAANEIFQTISNDFGFVDFTRASGSLTAEENLDRLVGLLRWFKQALLSWRKADEVSSAHLAAIFVVATKLDEKGMLWKLAPADHGGNTELADAMATFLSQSRLVIAPAPRQPAPIQAQESLDQLLAADAAQDWATLRHLTEHHPWGFFASVALTQTVRFLHCFHSQLLVRATGSVNQAGLAMQIVSALSIEDSLSFARASDNPYIQFAAVSRLFSSHDRIRQMTPAEEDALTELLVTISRTPEQWRAWMKAFNAHPVQAQVMQKALGRCLAAADDAALKEYMRSLVLQPTDIGRDTITACLVAFSELAPSEKRRRAWQLAYAHWSDWNFGEHDGHTKLTLIAQSPIDFAVVGYAAECLDNGQRMTMINQCTSALDEAEERWHPSSVECMAYICRILSRLQPITHGNVVGTDRQNWLQIKNSAYFPNDFKDSRFLRLRYHLQQLPMTDPQAN